MLLNQQMPKIHKQPKHKTRKQHGRRKEGSIELLRRHARGVMQALGKGHTERVYHRAMITSLNSERVPHQSEVIAPIYFMGEVVGFGRCDIVIGNLVVEFKANTACPKRTSHQLQKYLESMRATNTLKKQRRPLHGVVVNFGQRTGAVEVLFQSNAHVRKKSSC